MASAIHRHPVGVRTNLTTKPHNLGALLYLEGC